MGKEVDFETWYEDLKFYIKQGGVSVLPTAVDAEERYHDGLDSQTAAESFIEYWRS